MNLGYLRAFPMVLIAAAARSVARKAARLAAYAQPRPPAWLVVVFAAVGAAWLVNAMDWSFGLARLMVAASSASLVATLVLCMGWTTEPDELEKWLLRVILSALAASAPAFASVL